MTHDPDDLAAMLLERCKEDSPEFRKFIETLPDKLWAKHDLTAMRLGWELYRYMENAR